MPPLRVGRVHKFLHELVRTVSHFISHVPFGNLHRGRRDLHGVTFFAMLERELDKHLVDLFYGIQEMHRHVRDEVVLLVFSHGTDARTAASLASSSLRSATVRSALRGTLLRITFAVSANNALTFWNSGFRWA